jgi:hypothetical protein
MLSQIETLSSSTFDPDLLDTYKFISTDKIQFNLPTLQALKQYCEDNKLNPKSMAIYFDGTNVCIKFSHLTENTGYIFILTDDQWSPLIPVNSYH